MTCRAAGRRGRPVGACRRAGPSVRLVASAVAGLLLAALLGTATAQEQPTLRPAAMRAHLQFLSDDLLEGRAPGTRGGAIAARYIATQLAAAGVAPLRGSYFQPVPLIGWRSDPRRSVAEFGRGAAAVSLRPGRDAVLWLDSGADSAAVQGELIFVGYGVRAPEYDWDDFNGRDLRGRIVMVLVGDPPAPPDQPEVFDGPALTYYGRWTYKIEEATRRGAAAVLLVHTDEGAGYGWPVVESSFGRQRLALPRENAATGLALQGWISFDAARRILAAADLSLAELFVRAARRDFQPLATGIEARLQAAGSVRRFESPNVAGIVQGRHETRRQDVVVYTAHYDGLGIGTPVDGDSIYNGAYDNASGVALLLEVARAFAAAPAPPDRSVLFLFTTAEEAGILGAHWYVRQPLLPLQRTVAVLNIDGANLWGETRDIGATGLERSTLGLVFARQAAAAGLRTEGERSPARGLYFRSDHFPFALAGVPALSIDHGTDYVGRPAGWGDLLLARYESTHYHQPSDRFDPAFDMAGAIQQGIVAFLVGHEVATAAAPPRWHPGGQVRAPSGGR